MATRQSIWRLFFSRLAGFSQQEKKIYMEQMDRDAFINPAKEAANQEAAEREAFFRERGITPHSTAVPPEVLVALVQDDSKPKRKASFPLPFTPPTGPIPPPPTIPVDCQYDHTVPKEMLEELMRNEKPPRA